MNKLYGFRIHKSFASDDHWFKINEYGGRQLIRWSVLLILVGILYFIFPIQEFQDQRMNAALAVAPILISIGIAIVKTIIFSKTL
ncbi:MAG: SdpI family protein [Thermodesulfobacteriota bacterium]